MQNISFWNKLISTIKFSFCGATAQSGARPPDHWASSPARIPLND